MCQADTILPSGPLLPPSGHRLHIWDKPLPQHGEGAHWLFAGELEVVLMG